MRNHFFLLAAVLSLAACSSPKYAYNFDQYNYNNGKKVTSEKSYVQAVPLEEMSPLILYEHELLASASSRTVLSEEVKIPSTSSLNEKAERYKSMSKRERKDFRKEFKNEINKYAKELTTGDQGASIAATKELDDELKLAIIFGAVGITLTVLGGINPIFWVLGVIGLVVGLVFFIRWISTQ